MLSCIFSPSCIVTNVRCTLSQHVTAEGSALVKQAEDAASTKKVRSFSKKFVTDIL